MDELDQATFMFRTHFDLVMPPDLYQAAKRYRVMRNTRDPRMQTLVDAVARDYSEYWKLERTVYAGRHASVADKLKALVVRMRQDAANAIQYLRQNEHRITVDDPFE